MVGESGLKPQRSCAVSLLAEIQQILSIPNGLSVRLETCDDISGVYHGAVLAVRDCIGMISFDGGYDVLPLVRMYILR